MPRHRDFNYQLLILRSILVISSSFVFTNPIILFTDAGASSTPKNLVNLSAPDEGINAGNSNYTATSSNQFQNEYQFNRQSLSKSTSSDRHRSTTLGDAGVPSTTLTDSNLNELMGLNVLDYPTQDGRIMTSVPHCEGRLRLNNTRGTITDGPGYYLTNLQCIWLIDSGLNNATIRIQLHQFNTECNFDILYIFDGDSVYSPLVAALSGDKKDISSAFLEVRYEDLISTRTSDKTSDNSSSTTTTINSNRKGDSVNQVRRSPDNQLIELKTYSGKAFIYFHSDTALSMPGFYMTYSINSCPLDCSNLGECNYRTLTCKCNPGYFGDGCQHILCPNNCTSSIHGTCDIEKSCICNHDFTGADCSMRANQQHWNLVSNVNITTPARAFHQAAIVDSTMWLFGGKSQELSNTNKGIFNHKKTHMILSYDLLEHKWNNNGDSENFIGETGQDHLAELSGHSVAISGNKAFIFGGMAMNNTILNTLTVFDTNTKALHIIANKKEPKSEEEFVAPLSVVGHSANIIDGHMFVFWGYNPLYGYLNFAQKFNIANNSWSIIERRGSSVSGCIGHTSTFDPTSRLVFIYGGYNNYRSRKLYSFNPQTEVWIYLNSAPSARYYHSALIMNGLLIILGGNSDNSSQIQCFQPTHLLFDLTCSSQASSNNQTTPSGCGRKCWTVMEDDGFGVMKRHGHSVVVYNNQELILYGGFNGIFLSDLRMMKVQSCSNFTSELECMKSKLGINCNWNAINAACETHDPNSFGQASSIVPQEQQDCTKSEIKELQATCETRESCSDCLHTNQGCVWCGFFSVCQYNKCNLLSDKAILKPEFCYREETLKDSMSTSSRSSNGTQLLSPTQPINNEKDNEIDCKVDNCYLCQSKPYCSWQNDGCLPNSPINGAIQPPPLPSPSPQAVALSDDIPNITSNLQLENNSSQLMEQPDMSALPMNQVNKSFVTALTRAMSLLNSSPYPTCDIPCFMRRSCNECTTTKCIWCSTTEQCIDSTAYFAYHTTGQCMHYVAHSPKCSVASCSDIERCDKCLTNPKCGWLNDISNTGKGHCIEGTSRGPNLGIYNPAFDVSEPPLPNWFYTSCPKCQCNGHSYCRTNSGFCSQPCQNFTEGLHCDRCMAGYFGDPVNGGSCKPCRCNGHAQTCNRETGKCYCSTKGIVGHNCNRCDDKNYYIGDPSSAGNDTCYYNLTTDYQYTFNMSKSEDHFYSDINFINVPIRKDSDADFSIACSRLALVNITSGTSYKNRQPIQSGLECGSFRLRFPHDRLAFNEANYSFFVHVYRFQTPFILQISFSQHRNMHLPQFFFTFSSCFLFLFACFALVWKFKHEYDLYMRRQRLNIEMQQMASRPFSTILLEMFRPAQIGHKIKDTSTSAPDEQRQSISELPASEPTPISFEPCFGSNVGVLSMFVQLPGRPNLAIGSALVSLNEDVASSTNSGPADESSEQIDKRHQSRKDHVSIKNL